MMHQDPARAPSRTARTARSGRHGASVLLAWGLSACTSYYGVAVKDDRVYLTGETTFLFFSSSWVRRCVESGAGLRCADVGVGMGFVPAGGAPPRGRAEKHEEVRATEVAAKPDRPSVLAAVPPWDPPPRRSPETGVATEVVDTANVRVGDQVAVVLKNGTTYSGIFTGRSDTMMSLNCGGSPVAVYLDEVARVTRGLP